MIIADVEVAVILDYDFMYDHNCSLDIRNASLKIGKAHIQCDRDGQDGFDLRIRLKSIVTVTPGCKIMVRGKIDAENDYITQITEALVKSKSQSVLARQGKIGAKTHVDPSKGIVPLIKITK